jgi:serine O-acetyltransferase
VLCAGAVVLFGDDGMTIGAGTVIAANAVLTCSTGQGEIWAGSPARKIADRALPG